MGEKPDPKITLLSENLWGAGHGDRLRGHPGYIPYIHLQIEYDVLLVSDLGKLFITLVSANQSHFDSAHGSDLRGAVPPFRANVAFETKAASAGSEFHLVLLLTMYALSQDPASAFFVQLSVNLVSHYIAGYLDRLRSAFEGARREDASPDAFSALAEVLKNARQNELGGADAFLGSRMITFPVTANKVL